MHFGAWYTENGTTKSPIEWIVAEKDFDGKVLLLSRHIIDVVPFALANRDVVWADSDIRNFLSDEFYRNAFDDGERLRIEEARLHTLDNEISHMIGGPDTIDRIFLLSEQEAKAYFHVGDLASEPTPYACAKGSNGWWYLRSPGEYQTAPEVVLADGRIYNCSGHFNKSLIGVRPALLLSII